MDYLQGRHAVLAFAKYGWDAPLWNTIHGAAVAPQSYPGISPSIPGYSNTYKPNPAAWVENVYGQDSVRDQALDRENYYIQHPYIFNFLRNSGGAVFCDEVADVEISTSTKYLEATTKQAGYATQNTYKRTQRRNWDVSISIPKQASWVGGSAPNLGSNLFEHLASRLDTEQVYRRYSGVGYKGASYQEGYGDKSNMMFCCICMGNFNRRNWSIGPLLAGWWNFDITNWSQPVGGLENFTFQLTPASRTTYIYQRSEVTSSASASSSGTPTT